MSIDYHIYIYLSIEKIYCSTKLISNRKSKSKIKIENWDSFTKLQIQFKFSKSILSFEFRFCFIELDFLGVDNLQSTGIMELKNMIPKGRNTMQKQLFIFDTKENKILFKRWESPNCSEKLMIEHAEKFIARSKKYNNNCIIISNFQF